MSLGVTFGIGNANVAEGDADGMVDPVGSGETVDVDDGVIAVVALGIGVGVAVGVGVGGGGIMFSQ